jgi:putative thioredoxin
MALLSGLMGRGGSGETAGAELIKDSGTRTFMADVIEASRDVAVIVDFWAPWCGPCKQLTPVLERVVKAAGGKVRLVKVNIDENPEIAQQLRVQSIPMVYAFKGGQPVDGFAGALPESQVKAFVERLAGPIGPAPTDEMLEQAGMMLAGGQADQALQLYQRVLQSEPERPEAIAGAGRSLTALGKLAAAREILEKTPAEHANHVEIDGARSALALAEEAGTLGDPAELERRIAADGADHDARIDLATALFLRGQLEPAIDHLLASIKADREWQEGAARRRLIRFFEALGPQHPMTVGGRRKLSSVLFS